VTVEVDVVGKAWSQALDAEDQDDQDEEHAVPQASLVQLYVLPLLLEFVKGGDVGVDVLLATSPMPDATRSPSAVELDTVFWAWLTVINATDGSQQNTNILACSLGCLT
jgi:hypothetical protein